MRADTDEGTRLLLGRPGGGGGGGEERAEPQGWGQRQEERWAARQPVEQKIDPPQQQRPWFRRAAGENAE